MDVADEWGMFGSDDDSGDDDEFSSIAEVQDDANTNSIKMCSYNSIISSLTQAADASALYVTKTWLTEGSGAGLTTKYFGASQSNLKGENDENIINLVSKKMSLRGINVFTLDLDSKEHISISSFKGNQPNYLHYAEQQNFLRIFDACIIVEYDSLLTSSCDVTSNNETKNKWSKKSSKIRRSVVPGGIILFFLLSTVTESSSLVDENDSVQNESSKTAYNEKILQQYGFHPSVWDISNALQIYEINSSQTTKLNVISVRKRGCPVNQISCEWKENRKDWIQYEQGIMEQATVPLSAHERLSASISSSDSIRTLSDPSIQKATHALSTLGFCVIRDLYSPNDVLPLADAACNDLKEAIEILKQENHLDLLHPSITNDDDAIAVSYKELAMREDLRVDLRDGPSIRKKRQQNEQYKDTFHIQTHPSVSKIVTNTFHPTRIAQGHNHPQNQGQKLGDSELYRGNFGLWNFNGLGPDASPPPPTAHPIGFVISMPGCACQAIHADTPHLFENVDTIPPHYVNLFVPSRNGDYNQNEKENIELGGEETFFSEEEKDSDGEFTGNTLIGGTAFIVESHRLSICATLTTEPKNSNFYTNNAETTTDGLGLTTYSKEQREEMYKRIIRPSLCVGDALLFDCRILHFGLANRSKRKDGDVRGWRPLLYANLTTSWFSDPKNWNDRQCLFPE